MWCGNQRRFLEGAAGGRKLCDPFASDFGGRGGGGGRQLNRVAPSLLTVGHVEGCLFVARIELGGSAVIADFILKADIVEGATSQGLPRPQNVKHTPMLRHV